MLSPDSVEPQNIAVVHCLIEAHPNPFNPSTTIQYQLTKNTNFSLVVFDVQGRHVRTLQANHQAAGQYQVVWNGLDDDQREVPAGLYIARLASEEFAESIKLIYMK